MFISNKLEKLIESLSRFPGIGKRTAQRMAWYLLSQDQNFALELAETIKTTVQAFKPCSKCLMLSESDPCPICSSLMRDTDSLCIVESSADIQVIENMNEYKGLYFVLGHLLSPIDGYGPDQINAAALSQRVAQLMPKELILALKPSAEGEATIHYIWEIFKDKDVCITRLSTGLPFGGDLEYSSSNTLKSAWERRYGV
ncbi:MAG: recombination mediator RecR [Candidatus Cloacimonadaceae bacterium]|jgi:recombination protein RecR|nr:recombination mediator RecR [Candidatus Cloacimonadota bacterium]MDY0126803.1 recombination mediator RecR [Candidatus Cloacimonadaceae bacterium]MCB5254215.1 recombination mediator RecR [Candidatus Cloacimonadota bacterium]MCK9177496.1 recombination mediator RecR [Candidatus Cloacimonadota bacterium]MCK9243144.1 recombination mediator RecR [Candidatus Cloacimonadota bacterium]